MRGPPLHWTRRRWQLPDAAGGRWRRLRAAAARGGRRPRHPPRPSTPSIVRAPGRAPGRRPPSLLPRVATRCGSARGPSRSRVLPEKREDEIEGIGADLVRPLRRLRDDFVLLTTPHLLAAAAVRSWSVHDLCQLAIIQP